MALLTRMKQVIFIAFLCLPLLVFGQTKEICFTVDDLPTVSYDNNRIEFQQEIISKLVATFNSYQIPAIGFVNESKLYRGNRINPEQISLLKTWLAAGYELGNHTYAHKSYHKVSYEKFTQDIIDGEKVCKELVKEYDQNYHYFRHPFLHIGLNKEKYDSLTAFLAHHNYKEAPVSIDNDDYMFAYAYHTARKNKDELLMQKIGRDYVNYMEQKLLYFEQQSIKLLGRNIKHILLLHANAINAEYLDEIAERYKMRGYTFISLEEALKDGAYQTEITNFGNWGISWLDRWALSAGKKGDFFKDDPVTPDYIKAFLE